MKKPFLILLISSMFASCVTNIADEPEEVYSFSAVSEVVGEGDNVPVTLSFSQAGYKPDNAAWGDKWKKAKLFFDIVRNDTRGTVSDYSVLLRNGRIENGDRLDISTDGKEVLYVEGLSKGLYTMMLTVRTRYGVELYASAGVEVTDGAGVKVGDISVPSTDGGYEFDGDDVIIDMRIYSAENPWKFRARVTPPEAADKTLTAEAEDVSIVEPSVTDIRTINLVPLRLGTTRVIMRSVDGGAEASFGVKVIRSEIPLEGFTLPTDEADAGLDVAGRLECDINTYNDSHPYEYMCRPIPDTAPVPELVARSLNEDILLAAIENGNRLVLQPQKVGYATVEIERTDGTLKRVMKVAVISAFGIVLDAEESAASDSDQEAGVVPTKITIKAGSNYTPAAMHFEAVGRGTGRIDLTDPKDYFLSENLKNSRTAVWSVEDSREVYYLPGGSAYDVYLRLASKVINKAEAVHHTDDYPNYYDYYARYKLKEIRLILRLVEDYDTNLYRVSIDRKYVDPKYNISKFLVD